MDIISVSGHCIIIKDCQNVAGIIQFDQSISRIFLIYDRLTTCFHQFHHEIEFCCLHCQYIRINKQTQLHTKKSQKLSDEFIANFWLIFCYLVQSQLPARQQQTVHFHACLQTVPLSTLSLSEKARQSQTEKRKESSVKQ